MTTNGYEMRKSKINQCTVKLYFQCITAKTRTKEQVFGGFRLILFSYIGCFLQNQLENVLKVFLIFFFK